jgi:hypothetical protein
MRAAPEARKTTSGATSSGSIHGTLSGVFATRIARLLLFARRLHALGPVDRRADVDADDV